MQIVKMLIRLYDLKGWAVHLLVTCNKITFYCNKAQIIINHCHAEYFYVLHSFPISILLTCSILVVSMYFQSEWKTVWILIRWLHQNLHCFIKIYPSSAGQGLKHNTCCIAKKKKKIHAKYSPFSQSNYDKM